MAGMIMLLVFTGLLILAMWLGGDRTHENAC